MYEVTSAGMPAWLAVVVLLWPLYLQLVIGGFIASRRKRGNI